MKLIFDRTQVADPQMFMRRCGYGLHKTRNGEVSYVKRVHHDWYPRYHEYILEEKDKIVVNLHLDQRAPVYEGVTAHAGEYDGVVVEKEIDRIKNFIV